MCILCIESEAVPLKDNEHTETVSTTIDRQRSDDYSGEQSDTRDILISGIAQIPESDGHQITNLIQSSE